MITQEEIKSIAKEIVTETEIIIAVGEVHREIFGVLNWRFKVFKFFVRIGSLFLKLKVKVD